MAIRVQMPEGVRPWVDQVATYIHDPVARLRFLKAVAPVPPAECSHRHRFLRILLLALLATAAILTFSLWRGSAHTLPPAAPRPIAPVTESQSPGIPDVWPVERSSEWDTYSNGLRVDNHFAVSTHARSYPVFPLHGRQPAERRTQPAGIVFHTTESHLAPFEARQNGALKRIGESLLEYVQRRRSYNFLIDRFGRVYRIVPEEQAANHAGHSIWADDTWAWLNLNESFIGVSFEAETRQREITPAQARSATVLIEMLRSRYRIAARNCVTHAQVSVNPSNMRLGYHVDFASGFPFESVGLPDNYAAGLPAVWQFGFESDSAFAGAAGSHLQAGIRLAEQMFAAGSLAAGMQPADYRRGLRRHYRELVDSPSPANF